MIDLHERFAELDAIDFPDLRAHIERAASVHARQEVPKRADRRPRRLIAVATALAVFTATLVTVGGLIWLFGGGKDDQRPTEPSEQTPVTTVALEPPNTDVIFDEAADPVRYEVAEWQEIPLSPEVFEPGSQIGGFVAFNSGVIAYGIGPGGDGAMWLSDDGVTWTPLAQDFGPGAAISDVVSGGPGLVAVGAVPADGSSHAAVWLSVDGRSWSRAPEDSVMLSARMEAVVSGSFGLVAAGQSSGSATFWISADGVTWDRTVLSDAGTVADVAIGGPGLVAAGMVSGDGEDAAVWVSADAVAWNRRTSPTFGGVGNQWIAAVAARPGQVVAVGGTWTDTEGSSSLTWISADGLEWEPASGTSSGPLNAVVASGPGYTAVGDGSAGSAGNIWGSADGRVWAPSGDVVDDLQAVAPVGPGMATTEGRRLWITPPVEIPAEPDPAVDWAESFGLAPEAEQLPDGWILLGFDSEIFGRVEVVPGDAAAGPGGLVALGRNGAGYIAWTSPDGLAWSATGVGEVIPGSITLGPLVAGDPGYVVLGSRGEYRRGLAFFSADGVTWQQVEIADDPAAVITGLARWRGGFAAAGLDSRAGKHVTVWTSPDGTKWEAVLSDPGALEDPDIGSIGLLSSPEALLAVAIDFDPTDQSTVHFPTWLSTDGTTFTRNDGIPGLCPDPLADNPAAVSPGKLALVCAESEFGVMFTSDDGLSWEEAPLGAAPPFAEAFTGADPSDYEWIDSTGVVEIAGREVSLGSVCLGSDGVCATVVLMRE